MNYKLFSEKKLFNLINFVNSNPQIQIIDFQQFSFLLFSNTKPTKNLP